MKLLKKPRSISSSFEQPDMDNLTILLNFSFTKNQVLRRLSSLSDFLNYWLFNDLTLQAALTEFNKKNTDLEFSLEFYQQFNKANMSMLLKDLETKVNQLKILTVMVPIDIPE